MTTGTPARKGLSRHAVIMLLCCLIPLVLFVVLWKIGVSSYYLFFGVMLLCPLLHIVMMRGMNKGDDSGHQH